MRLMAQSLSMIHARSELRRKMNEKPTRVATDELQLHDFVRAEACRSFASKQVGSVESSGEVGRGQGDETHGLTGAEECES